MWGRKLGGVNEGRKEEEMENIKRVSERQWKGVRTE